MIDALLRAHGLRTGRYTSPHLDSVRERISIEAEPISEERFVEVYREVAPVARFLDEKALEIGTDTLTYFDMTTAMAFAALADAPVDVAVVEVGLGGAEDSTNVLQAQTCVITPIGLDHMEWLGDTIADIAWAKAGIVHKGATLVCAAQPEEAVLGAGVERSLDPEVVRAGFAAASSPGRLERMRSAPAILLDAAHNPAGMAATVAALQEEFDFRRLVAVVGVLADKDAYGILEALEPIADAVVVTRSSSPRAMPAAALADVAVAVFGADRVRVAPAMPDAIETAVALAESDVDGGEPAGLGVLITGSVVTVADARRLLRR